MGPYKKIPDIYIVLNLFKTIGFQRHYQTYAVETTAYLIETVRPKQLFDHRPVTCLKNRNGNDRSHYISTRITFFRRHSISCITAGELVFSHNFLNFKLVFSQFQSKVVFLLNQDEIPDVSSLTDADDVSTAGDSSTGVDTLIIESDADTSLEGQLTVVNPIEQDFSVLWPEHEDHLYEKWDLYYNGIIEYGKQVENWQGSWIGVRYLESLSIDKKETLAFFLLPVILRGKGKGKKGLCSVKEAITSFLDIQPEVADILQISKAIDATKKPQPFVVCKGTLLAPTQTFVILERRPVRQESLLKDIDFCFKALYILDMAYQPSCSLVWQFIQNVINEIKEAHMPSCIIAFLALKSKNCLKRKL
ncbi:hypothetical protein BSL78_20178 [Apostichopus japonicus]|uniref:Uncharacterized protein n=1 Tax=Stichopus japonicus TaxID=307972 RepID=A0A2G8K4P1_STIJA|nr:hypothetical protein BSL78_20178 [Apostichopus japonicus]